MRHFPIFLDLRGKRVLVSGAGDFAEAKLRLILKTEAEVSVFGDQPTAQVQSWADAGRITLAARALQSADVQGATLVYCANGNAALDQKSAAIAARGRVLSNTVDDLEGSDFITPAIVDRDPVTVAIGTEGAAPVLARQIKADIEAQLPAYLGVLARLGLAFRPRATALPQGERRRRFWSDFYFREGPRALAAAGVDGANTALGLLLARISAEEPQPGHVWLVGAGPGDPELLTLKARRLLHEAAVVIHDRLVPEAILDLARREATMIEVGKNPNGASWKQEDINDAMIAHAQDGAQVVRLKSGDPAIFGRLDEEMDALDAAGVAFDVVPGLTSASAAAAAIKVSLTRRRRNGELRLITGHDVDGFAERDWAALASEGSVAAIYMGVKAAEFLRGRLLIHGAAADTPVTAIENASRSDQRIIATDLLRLPDALRDAAPKGPVILLYGVAPRDALAICADVSAQKAG